MKAINQFAIGFAIFLAVHTSPAIDVAKSLEAFEPIVPVVEIVKQVEPEVQTEKKSLNEENIDWQYCPGTDGSLITVDSIKALTALRIKREVTFQIKGQILLVDVITSIHIKATMDGYTIKDETQKVGI